MSAARYQNCIFCDTAVRNGTNHVVARCSRFAVERARFLAAQGLDSGAAVDVITLAVLRATPDDKAFNAAVALAAAIDQAAVTVWGSE